MKDKSFLTKDNLFCTYHSKAKKMRGLYSIELVNKGIKTHVCKKACKDCLICYTKSEDRFTILEVIK